MNPFRPDLLKGKNALVTGAGSGIGAAIALALGQVGASVGIHYNRNREGADALVHQLREIGVGRIGGRHTLEFMSDLKTIAFNIGNPSI